MLADYGLKAGDITDLIITHAYHDHIADAHYYKNATVHIQREEYLNCEKYLQLILKT